MVGGGFGPVDLTRLSVPGIYLGHPYRPGTDQPAHKMRKAHMCEQVHALTPTVSTHYHSYMCSHISCKHKPIYVLSSLEHTCTLYPNMACAHACEHTHTNTHTLLYILPFSFPACGECPASKASIYRFSPLGGDAGTTPWLLNSSSQVPLTILLHTSQ